MDEDIARWILEFLLRQPSISDQVLESLLSTLPLSNTDSRLKKTVVVRRIESECSNGTVSENILDFLERIEELDYQAGKEATCSDSMRAAYCAVAVDCTVRFLEDDGANDGGQYFGKVQSVWKGRVSELEKSENCLVSEELLSWRDNVETAIWDSDLCCNILTRNTRNEALKALRLYVREAWRELGPTFLEIAAENEMVKKMVLNGSQELDGCSTGQGTVQVVEEEKVGNVVNTCPELVGYDHNMVIGGANGSCVVEAERGGAKHGGEISTIGKPAVGNEVGSLKKQSPLGCEDVAPHGRRSGEAGTGRSRGAEIADTNGVQEEHRQSNQYHNGPTPEIVHRVHEEEPRSSSTKLSRVVNDPSSEAMRMAETISLAREAEKVDSDVAIRNKKREVRSAATTGDNGELAVQNDGLVGDDAAEDAHRKENASAVAEGGNVGDQITDQKNHGPLEKTRPPKRSSTDTAHVFERDDSIDGSASGSSIRFDLPPSPKRRNMSPLKKIEFLKLTRRRQKKRWTADEEDALRTGVEKFGVGNWKFIHSAYHSRFQDRTECDLKDKWRNLTKSSR